MARCGFCKKRFESAQAVRGHLRVCEVYRSGQPIGSGQPKAQPNRLAQPIRSEPKAGGIAEGVLDEVRAEEGRLALRKIKAEHKRLDAEEAEAARRTEQESERARRTELEAAGQAKRQTRRRAILERVKARAVYAPAAVIRAQYPVIGSTEEAAALEEIERRLSTLDVETIPEDELIQMAVGIRNGIYSQVIQASNHRVTSAMIDVFLMGAKARIEANNALLSAVCEGLLKRDKKE